jgi:N-carbamoyl-L-amino-acid hydrolase
MSSSTSRAPSRFSRQIDAVALDAAIEQLAAISEAPAPAVTRILFSETDLQARVFIRAHAAKLGLGVREDAVGNIFARWNGTEPELPAVATGSHTDAIPNAGRYDGVVGVLGGFEAVAALQRAGFRPRRSIDVIMFTAEEPTRFGLGCLGSRLMCGTLTPEAAAKLRDPEGRSLDELRRNAGYAGALDSVRLARGHYHRFVELHIEQGPLLEREGVSIGLVEHIAGPSSYRVTVRGEGGHAGAVMMADRRDAGVAAAEIALRVEEAAKQGGSPDLVATTGVFRIEPGAVNSIPHRATLEIDLRDTNLSTRNVALQRIRSAAEAICLRRGVTLDFNEINADDPATCDAAMVAMGEAACQRLGLSVRRMVSRAYHDSLFMARICPTTMIFIPCRNGWSHRPDEFASSEAIAGGVAVLTEMLAELAG